MTATVHLYAPRLSALVVALVVVGLLGAPAHAAYTINIRRAPTVVPQTAGFYIDVDYTADAESVIVAEILENVAPFPYHGNGAVVVNASGTTACTNIFVTVANFPAVGTGYILKAFIGSKTDVDSSGIEGAWNVHKANDQNAVEVVSDSNGLAYATTGGLNPNGATPVCGSPSFSKTTGFDKCKFNFGTGYEGPLRTYFGMNYLTVWIGSYSSSTGNNFNPYHHGAMLGVSQATGATPTYYAYIIAFLARHTTGWLLKDCDVGTPSLCQRGSEFIRQHRTLILNTYSNFSAETAARIGTNGKILWLLEPDFFQYSSYTAGQENGGLSGSYMRSLVTDIIARIKQHLPQATISLDISPWIELRFLGEYLINFANLDIELMNTSSGRTMPNNTLIRTFKDNPVTWNSILYVTARPILADAGYGVAGVSLGHDDNWDKVANLNARIADGVISIMQANPKQDWTTTVASVRPQLTDPLPYCNSNLVPHYDAFQDNDSEGSTLILIVGSSVGSVFILSLIAYVTFKYKQMQREEESGQQSKRLPPRKPTPAVPLNQVKHSSSFAASRTPPALPPRTQAAAPTTRPVLPPRQTGTTGSPPPPLPPRNFH